MSYRYTTKDPKPQKEGVLAPKPYALNRRKPETQGGLESPALSLLGKALALQADSVLLRHEAAKT